VLQANDMPQAQLVPAPGQLSDHDDPTSKTIRLSEPVYGVPSVAAMAIAAHETGHAIQDKVGYKPFRVRTSLVPLAHLGSRFGLPAAMLGLFMDSPLLIQIGALTHLGALVFQFATLPVEFNASRRAMQQLEALRLVNEEEEKGARQVLWAAALTYVAGVASSAGYLVFLAIAGGRFVLRRPPAATPLP
jgi:Zn-dependent membrane protease YugP